MTLSAKARTDLFPPPALDDAARVRGTASCRDADDIPKVADAGSVVVEGGERLQVMHNGLRVLADGYYGAWMTGLIQELRGHHEPQEERLFHAALGVVAADAVMVEVGAFWAYYTLWFLKDAPGRRALGIEPDPVNLEVGRGNARLNGLAPELLHGVLVDRADRPVAHMGETSGPLADVPAFDAAALVRRAGGRVDLMLCDAQGAEVDLLAGLGPVIRDEALGLLFLSTHGHVITGDPLTHQTCLRTVQDLGGTILAEHDVHESFSGDGLIVASFRGVPDGWNAPEPSRNRYSTALFRNPLFDLALERAAAAAMLADERRRTVAALYRLLLGRDPDPAGLAHHLAMLERTGEIARVVAAIEGSEEFARRFGWS